MPKKYEVTVTQTGVMYVDAKTEDEVREIISDMSNEKISKIAKMCDFEITDIEQVNDKENVDKRPIISLAIEDKSSTNMPPLILTFELLNYDLIAKSNEKQLSMSDIKELAKNIVKEYLSTEEGKQTYIRNNNSFDWADFATNVPNEICEKYGIRLINNINCNGILDWDEQLINDTDIFPEK